MQALVDESHLIIAACQGSVEAFELLVLHYEPRIRRMIYSQTQDRHLTQDLCQETFLAAYRALPCLQGAELHFAPWLYRIALNQVRSEWRRRKQMTWVPLASAPGYGKDACDESGESFLESTDHFEERVEQRDVIQRVLAHLPEDSARCLLLDAEGFSYREIAAILQVSLDAVRSRLCRARKAFQQLYTKLDQEGHA